MKLLIQILFSIFFIIAIGDHVYELFKNDFNCIWWHLIYFITYGVCWWTFFSDVKSRSLIYLVMAAFPFTTHLYYGIQHALLLDRIFWVCLLVCILLPAGFIFLKKEII